MNEGFTVLALDQATRTGWTVGGSKIELTDWVSGHFKAPKRDEEGERLNIVYDETLALIEKYQPDLVAYERMFNPTFTDAKRGVERQQFNVEIMAFLERVAGAVKMAAARTSTPTEAVRPQSWQATLKLPRKSTLAELHLNERPDFKNPLPELSDPQWKKKMTMRAVRMLGAHVTTFDEADSWGICYHCLHGKPAVERATNDLFARALL